MAPFLLWGRGGTDSRLSCRAFLCGSWAQPAVVILEHARPASREPLQSPSARRTPSPVAPQ